MAQQIRELMTPNPVTLPGTASVHEAATAMRDAQIGDVIVIENNEVCGIVRTGISWCGPWPSGGTRPPRPWPTSAATASSP